jgi:alpha-ribazole phosphatase
MEIYLIRHTAVQAPGICYGHYDVPLADTFAAEVAQLRPKLPPPPYRPSPGRNRSHRDTT